MKANPLRQVNMIIRQATVDDLPTIHQLIRQSFEAMIPHSWFRPSFWRNAAESLITSELSSENFQHVYFSNDKDNCFWVAETDAIPKAVVGCIGAKREKTGDPTVELVRMAVDESYRGHGIGKMLFETLVSFCKSTDGIKKIFLDTGNPDSVKFYEKVGFTIITHWFYWSAEYLLDRDSASQQPHVLCGLF
jgi:N-acetylglutamate synthase-like GNAT family acetyltransferase